MEIFGFFSALLIGLILGLIGGGGSILTVPIFVYLLGISPLVATAYSLFVVGTTALVGAISNHKKGMVDVRTGFIFAVPAFIGVYVTRRYLLSLIPEDIFYISSFLVTKDVAIMLFFSILMLAASFFMINGRAEVSNTKLLNYNVPLLTLEGLVVGVLTGFVGAGGGFLIIPALVFFAKLPMKKAIATSLMIISIKSLIGFIGDIQNFEIDWFFLLSFTSISVIGIFLGIYFSKFINENKLKKVFGWFVFLMALFIIIKELI
jgi:uncharacterized membrane protein YfcA|tara:strand:- start:2512 stop:3297 length:786 start_codon:yes stop_codon:yes gene_type:complete